MENDWKVWKTWHLPWLLSLWKSHMKLIILIIMTQISGSESHWESFKKKLLELHHLYIGVLTGTHYNGYSLDFFGSCRYVCMSRFHWERNTTFWMKLRSNCDSFDDGIVDMLSSLASQYGSYKEKERSGKFGKRPQYCWI